MHFPNATQLTLRFDPRCATEYGNDFVTIVDPEDRDRRYGACGASRVFLTVHVCMHPYEAYVLLRATQVSHTLGGALAKPAESTRQAMRATGLALEGTRRLLSQAVGVPSSSTLIAASTTGDGVSLSPHKYQSQRWLRDGSKASYPTTVPSGWARCSRLVFVVHKCCALRWLTPFALPLALTERKFEAPLKADISCMQCAELLGHAAGWP